MAELEAGEMAKDVLFLLKPGFPDNGDGPFYCPECAAVEGLLAYYPSLCERLEIRRIDFSRPRTTLVSMLGEDHQSCPVLVLAESVERPREKSGAQEINGRQFLAGDRAIACFLAARFGLARPHGEAGVCAL